MMITADDLITTLKASDVGVRTQGIQPDKDLTEQGFDSLDVSSLIFQVEKSYGIKITMSKSAEIRTLMDLVECVNNFIGIDQDENQM
jgi:acyl carrier protein